MNCNLRKFLVIAIDRVRDGGISRKESEIEKERGTEKEGDMDREKEIR